MVPYSSYFLCQVSASAYQQLDPFFPSQKGKTKPWMLFLVVPVHTEKTVSCSVLGSAAAGSSSDHRWGLHQNKVQPLRSVRAQQPPQADKPPRAPASLLMSRVGSSASRPRRRPSCWPHLGGVPAVPSGEVLFSPVGPFR